MVFSTASEQDQATLDYVTSRDGTRIAVERFGQGRPLVLVHGGTADRHRWRTVIPGLATERTVYAMDRRGRGDSGDAPAWSIEREFEDVAAVVDAIGERAALLGHSFGGVCVLHAALLTSNVDRLIVYEGAGDPTDGLKLPTAVIERLESLLAEGRREEMLVAFFREIVRMPEQELDLLRSLPAWQGRVAAAPSVLREIRAADSFHWDRESFRSLSIPTMLLVGGASDPAFRRQAEAFATVLPGARIEVLPGQRHAAMDTAPDLFVQSVLAFLAS